MVSLDDFIFAAVHRHSRLANVDASNLEIHVQKPHKDSGRRLGLVVMANHLEIANKKSLKDFVNDYLPPRDQWSLWTHPKTKEVYTITLQKAGSVPGNEFDVCFNLVEHTSGEDYKRSKDGWRPKFKRKEMRLLDLKYFLVKRDNKVEGFCSFMPTIEDDYRVIYCYELHLALRLQGSGLGRILMDLLSSVGANIPEMEKIMLTCFRSNPKALQFYRKLGFETDENSPPPKMLRNGTMVKADYIILSKQVTR